MNPAPDTGDPGLVGGVVIGGPLQSDGLRRTFFKPKNIVRISADAPWEERRPSNRGKHFCRGPAESAVAGKVARKGRRNEVGPLIRNPGSGIHPLHAAMLSGWVGGRARPTEDRDFANGK